MKLTVQFNDDGGDVITSVFDDANNTVVTNGGAQATYTADLAANAMHVSSPEFTGTVTFANPPSRTVGATTRYNTSDGRAGLATIIAVA